MSFHAPLEPLLRWLRLRRVLPYIPKNAILLDIGCGPSATLLKTVSPRIREGHGVDLKVQPTEFGNITISQFKFDGTLPYKDAQFDIVAMLAVLEHIEKEQEILQEIYRVLVPGGRLVLTVPSIWSQPILEFLAYRLKIISEEEIRDHKRYYNREKLKQVLIDSAGFETFKHEYFQLYMNNFCTVIKRRDF